MMREVNEAEHDKMCLALGSETVNTITAKVMPGIGGLRDGKVYLAYIDSDGNAWVPVGNPGYVLEGDEYDISD